MKRLLLIALSFVPLFSMAQDDDLYLVSKKEAKKIADKKLRKSFESDPDRQYSVYSDNTFDDDAYNRRGSLSDQTMNYVSYSDSISMDSTVMAMDTVSEVRLLPRKQTYVYGDDEDFYYSRRMSRLYHGYYCHSPYYWDIYCGGFWYDPWYDPYFYHYGWGWYNSWYDPYFYGYSWYGGWNHWYNGWYAGYGPHYWNYYHYGYGGGSYHAGNIKTNPNYHPRSSSSSVAQNYGGLRNGYERSTSTYANSYNGGRGASASSRYGYVNSEGKREYGSGATTNRRGVTYSPRTGYGSVTNRSSNSVSSSSSSSRESYTPNRSYSTSSSSNRSSTSSVYTPSNSSSSSSSSRSYSSGSSYSSGGSFSGGGSRGGGGGGGSRGGGGGSGRR